MVTRKKKVKLGDQFTLILNKINNIRGRRLEGNGERHGKEKYT